MGSFSIRFLMTHIETQHSVGTNKVKSEIESYQNCIFFRIKKVTTGKSGRRTSRVLQRRCWLSGVLRVTCVGCWRGCVGGDRALLPYLRWRHPYAEYSRVTSTLLEPQMQGGLLEIISGRFTFFFSI